LLTAKFNRLLGVIRELETKVIQQQTQKLQDAVPTAGVSIGTSSPLQDTSSHGPMEETTLDFENLVLGKKYVPNQLQTSSPALTTFRNPQPQGFTSSIPSTPVGLMSPMNLTSMSQTPPPPAAQNSFFPPLQPTLYTASTGPNPSSSSSFQGANFAPSRSGMGMSNMAYNPQSAAPGGFGVNPWSAGTISSESSLPTIAPPPNKSQYPPAGFPSQTKPSNNGLDKYQSLL
jgi:hypothetical protein